MKLITAIVPLQKLPEIKAALDSIDIHGMTVTEVRGSGCCSAEQPERVMPLVSQFKVEIMADDEEVQQNVDVILQSANTGAAGSGKVYTRSLCQAVRVRTGERGLAAI